LSASLRQSQDYLMNRKCSIYLKWKAFVTLHVFTVTFDQIKASLLNKSINSLKKETLLTLWMVVRAVRKKIFLMEMLLINMDQI